MGFDTDTETRDRDLRVSETDIHKIPRVSWKRIAIGVKLIF